MYSVVIPVYQAKDTLTRCVQSWLSQTESDLELILVDDGSSDGSETLCDELQKKDSRIRTVHQKNTGVSAARNAGIEVAEGDFLLFTDSDDYVAADYLAKMAKLQKETDSDLVLCGFHHLYEGADILKLPEKIKETKLLALSEEFLSLYEKSFLNMPWNKLYKRVLMGRFDTSLSLGEDLLFNLDYLRRCERIAVLSEALCYYIQEEQKVTLSSKKRKNRQMLSQKICQATEDFYKEHWGNTSSMEGAVARIFTRYMNEVMDECEKLPKDKTLTYQEKLQVIENYAKDFWVRTRGDSAVFLYLDYRILWYFLKRKQVRMVYLLCVLRTFVVDILHRIRRRAK